MRTNERWIVQRELDAAVVVAIGSIVLTMFITLADRADDAAPLSVAISGLTVLALWPLVGSVKWGVVVCMNWMDGLLMRRLVLAIVAAAAALVSYWTTSMILSAVESALQWWGLS